MARNMKSTWPLKGSFFFQGSRRWRHSPIDPLDRLLTWRGNYGKNNALSLFHFPRCNDVCSLSQHSIPIYER